MASFGRIVERLPSLYRPTPDEDGLLLSTLRAMAAEIDGSAERAAHVLRSHWLDHADRARFDPHFLASREERPPEAPGEEEGEEQPAAPEILDHPYVRDLARLGSLLGTPPWHRPLRLRETVEAYRLRLRRTVALHRGGLGTVTALRRAVESQLPVDLRRPPELRDRPFSVEELPALARRSEAARTLGAPDGLLGPLMRFRMVNEGALPVPPTVYLTGVAEEPGLTDAARGPAVELYRPGTDLPGIALAFDGTLEADTVLRLLPAYSSWVGVGDGGRRAGVRRATSRPDEETPADPAAPGPWVLEEDGPEQPVRALLQSRDRVLWAAAGGDGDAGELWRFEGAAWRRVADLPPPTCLAEHRHHLLVGTSEGLLRVPLFPEPAGDAEAEAAFDPEPVPGLDAQGVHALVAAGDGSWWAGTDRGLARVREPDGAAEVTELPLRDAGGDPVAVVALAAEEGVVHAGTPLGLLQHQPGAGSWHAYAGGGATEAEADWLELPAEPDGGAALPAEDELFLPGILAVLRGPDGSLWLGTERGLARYRARPVRGLAFETVLEAFPDLAAGPVPALAVDERGGLWCCTDRGLLRFDGRDFQQRRSETGWRSLGAAARLFDTPEGRPRGSWRFLRGEGLWQRLDDSGAWRAEEPAARTTDQRPTLAIAWTDGVEADRGTWDGDRFERASGVAAGGLRVRVKPSEDRIVPGGLPAVPRLPPGESTWRYLALDQQAPEGPEGPGEGPTWTPEGRRLPAGPPPLPAGWPGRFGVLPPPLAGTFDEALFPYPPAARVRFDWRERRLLTALVRLGLPGGGDEPEPEVVERLWQGIERVRPAGVRAALAAGETHLRGVDDGNPE